MASTRERFFVRRCESDNDHERSFNIYLDCFLPSEHPVVDALFPHHGTAIGRLTGAKRWTESAKRDVMGHYLQVIDRDSDTAVGQARWGIIKAEGIRDYTMPIRLPAENWADDEKDMHAFAEWCLGEYTTLRRAYIKKAVVGRPCFTLTSISVLPEARNQGLGKDLMLWGIHQADACGAEVRIAGLAIDVNKF